MKSDSDRELVAGLNRGNKQAFSELMTRHGPAVYRFAWALADEPHQADDLMQDTFLVMWKRRRKIALVGESVLPWLLTTCRFTTYNANRSRRTRRTFAISVAENSASSTSLVVAAEERIAAAEELIWVRADIANLEPVDQQLIQRCLIEGESYADAAAALDLTPSAARKRVERARRQLAATRADN